MSDQEKTRWFCNDCNATVPTYGKGLVRCAVCKSAAVEKSNGVRADGTTLDRWEGAGKIAAYCLSCHQQLSVNHADRTSMGSRAVPFFIGESASRCLAEGPTCCSMGSI